MPAPGPAFARPESTLSVEGSEGRPVTRRRLRFPWIGPGITGLWVIGFWVMGLSVVGVAVALAGCADGDVEAVLQDAIADGAVGGVVFVDDGDEHLDGDPGAAGATVQIHNRFATMVGEVTTTADGRWELGDLPEVGAPYAASVPIEHSGAIWSVRRVVEMGEPIALMERRPESCETCPIDSFPLPDLIPLATVDPVWVAEGFPGPDRYSFDTETSPGRVLMRIGTATANMGQGPLLVVGRDPIGDHHPVDQRLVAVDGQYRDIEAGRFVFHPDHDHIHLDRFEVMELVDRSSGMVVASSKQSFCLTDVVPVDGERPAIADGTLLLDLLPWQCGEKAQGINVGWADYYGPELPDQFIDVTGVGSGDWILRISVDPENLLVEADEANNVIEFDVEIPDDLSP